MTKSDEFDNEFEPPVLIGTTTQLRQTSSDDFDSRTLLNYLLSQKSEATELGDTVLPDHHTHHTEAGESAKEESSSETGYNMSMESGVVMDPDPDVVRKVSEGSNSLSQGSHSYICTRGTISCSCSECKVHRERIHSGTGINFTGSVGTMS